MFHDRNAKRRAVPLGSAAVRLYQQQTHSDAAIKSGCYLLSPNNASGNAARYVLVQSGEDAPAAPSTEVPAAAPAKEKAPKAPKEKKEKAPKEKKEQADGRCLASVACYCRIRGVGEVG